MERVYDICCGIDVHKKLIVACLRQGRRQELREFGATTRELLRLCDWLREGGCQMAAMESTGSYWKPLYNVLEASGLEAMVVNARHMRNVPGRKTDAKDAEWIADLLQHGLLEASYIPGRGQRELRELLVYRKSLVSERARELNRIQKMLEGANIKLSGTVRDINGKSARRLLEHVLTGEPFDSAKYDEMYGANVIAHNLKATKEQVIDDLNGVLSQPQREMMRVALGHVDSLSEYIRQLDGSIDDSMKPGERDASAAIQDVPGIGGASARAVISVIGTDMGRFPTDRHISSWAGLSPGNNESAGRRRSGRTTRGNALLRETLIVCAHSAARKKDSYFHAQFERLKLRRGAKRAYVAVAHSMLVAIYHVLKDGVVFKDLGAGYYSQFNRERKIGACLKKLKALGYDVNAAAA